MRATLAPPAGTGFATALRGEAPGGHWLVHGDGHRARLPVARWHGEIEPAAAAVVARCTGPTIDLGCGPGRITRALGRAGISALGIDACAEAVAATRSRGAVAIHQDLFDPLPAEGRWAHAVLLDGNIGIGGDPVALLRRCRSLLAPAGTVLVELDGPGAGCWRGHARVAGPRRLGPVFPWARLGIDEAARVAARAGFAVRAVVEHTGRWFAELGQP
ncbi:class I SAM-dependent methyltransferase [Asanoa sp. NPDC049573]|uniref:class I SAM-dependent methyltransferase n=1 Tax=Asanoa sp. NPDC049573 TaxID=3155396 RepID=UPI00342E94B0